MKFHKSFLFCFLFSFPYFAQNLDSIYNSYINLYSTINTPLPEGNISGGDEGQNHKCAFSIVNDAKLNFNRFSSAQQKVLSTTAARFELDTSFVTPGGFFRIHYDTQGSNQPAYNLNLLAQAFDSSYKFQITNLGYLPPPADFGISTDKANPDNLYDVYIMSIAPTYGWTQPDSSIGNNKWTSFIVIDNAYSIHPTKGIDGARVTAAHEFHHAVQIGSYINRSDDTFFYELSSTAFEEFIFDEINDYYFYMRSYFNNPARTFGRFSSGNDGYDLAIWNIYLQKKFDFDIIKRIWQLMPESRALIAIDDALNEIGTSFKSELNEFGEWTYFTGYRSRVELPYFKEARNYPLIRPLIKINFLPPQMENIFNSNASSNNFIQYADNSQGRKDTLIIVVSNANVTGGLNSNSPEVSPFTMHLSSNSTSGLIQVADNYFFDVELTGSNTRIYSQKYILNNASNAVILPLTELAYPYPQPYRAGVHSKIHIPVSAKPIERAAELYIFTISMDFVFSATLNVTALDAELRNEPNVVWNGKDGNGNDVPAGIYIYATKRGNEVIKGKLAIFNE